MAVHSFPALAFVIWVFGIVTGSGRCSNTPLACTSQVNSLTGISINPTPIFLEMTSQLFPDTCGIREWLVEAGIKTESRNATLRISMASCDWRTKEAVTARNWRAWVSAQCTCLPRATSMWCLHQHLFMENRFCARLCYTYYNFLLTLSSSDT